MSQINLMSMVQVNPATIYEEVYDKGEMVSPKQPGLYTFYSSQSLHSSEDRLDPQAGLEAMAGMPAPRPTQVVWLAADDEALKACAPAFAKLKAQMIIQQGSQGGGLIR